MQFQQGRGCGQMSDEQTELGVFGKSRSFKARRKKLLDNDGKSIE